MTGESDITNQLEFPPAAPEVVHPGSRVIVLVPELNSTAPDSQLAKQVATKTKIKVFTVKYDDNEVNSPQKFNDILDAAFSKLVIDNKMVLAGLIGLGTSFELVSNWAECNLNEYSSPALINVDGVLQKSVADSRSFQNRKPVLSIYDGNGKDKLRQADKLASILGSRNHLRLYFDQEGLVDIMAEYFSPEKERERFMQVHQFASTASPRWKKVEGASNVRDLGGFRVGNLEKHGNKPSATVAVRPNYIFRAAALGNATSAGQKSLKDDLNIRVIFDLRASKEYDYVPKAEFASIETVEIPVFPNKVMNAENLNKSSKDYEGDENRALLKTYMNILKSGGEAYKAIFEHIRDRPDEPFVFHCMSGKDRTGIFAMVLLLLLGVDEDTVCREFELTTFGLLPEMQRMKDLLRTVGKEMSDEAVANMLSCPYEACSSAIEVLKKDYNGPEEYVKAVCGLSDEDIATIRKNLLVEVY